MVTCISKHNIAFSAIVVVLVCVFFADSVVWADADALAPFAGNPKTYAAMQKAMLERQDAHQVPIDDVIYRNRGKAKRLSGDLEKDCNDLIAACKAENMFTRLTETLRAQGGQIQVIFVKSADELPVFDNKRVWGHAGTYVTVFALEGEDKTPEGRKKILGRLFHEIRARSTKAQEMFDAGLDGHTFSNEDEIDAYIRSMRDAFENKNIALQEKIEAAGPSINAALAGELEREFSGLRFAAHPSVINRDYAMQMGMFMSLALHQAQTLTMRQEHKLKQELYLRREDGLTQLWLSAAKRKKIAHYEKHGLSFDYARITRKDLEKLGLSKVVEECGHAFSHCLYNSFEALFLGQKYAMSKGQWLLFVVEDMVPKEFAEYAAVHERGEQLSIGNHRMACELEFAVAKKEKQLTPLITWLRRHYPRKIYADVGIAVPEEDATEFYNVWERGISPQEAAAAKALADGFFWPVSLSRIGDRCRDATDDAESKVSDLYWKCRNKLYSNFNHHTSVKNTLRAVESIVRKEIKKIVPKKDRQYVVFEKLNKLWSEKVEELDEILRKWFDDHKEEEDKSAYLAELDAASIAGPLRSRGIFKENLETLVKGAWEAPKRAASKVSDQSAPRYDLPTAGTDPLEALAMIRKILPKQWLGKRFNVADFIADFSRLLGVPAFKERSTMLFSENVTFTAGLGVLLEKVARSNPHRIIAVVATNDRERALIEELNRSRTEDRKIVVVDSVADMLARPHGRRIYYFKMAGDPVTTLNGITTFDITDIVRKIIDALGKASSIINREKLELLHQAAQAFAQAA